MIYTPKQIARITIYHKKEFELYWLRLPYYNVILKKILIKNEPLLICLN
jgi:hypothetical protein